MYAPFEGNVEADHPPPMKIGTCARWATVFYTPVLHHYIMKRVVPSPEGTHYWFDSWIHQQFCLLGFNTV
jgi:hypothetical protein